MKTLNLQPESKFISFSFFVLLYAVFNLMTGCQKEEMAPSSLATQEVASIPDHTINTAISRLHTLSVPFTMLVIDHSSAQTDLPSYSVELLSNGLVNFTGRENTNFTGKKCLQAGAGIFSFVKSYMKENKFEQLENLTIIPDLPIITTSFRDEAGKEFIQKLDYNQVKQSRLIEMRNTMEQMLGITRLVSTNRGFSGPQSDMKHL